MAFATLASVLTGLVRRVGEAAKGAATDTNRIQERTMRFMVMGKATKESEAGAPPTPEAIAAMQKYNFGAAFTPNPEIAKVKFK